MDNRKRILADTPCGALEPVPCFGMACGLKALRCSAHVALGFKLGGVFLQHPSSLVLIFNQVAFQRHRIRTVRKLAANHNVLSVRRIDSRGEPGGR